jgi:threonine/homoserine/homoserine lactone efflux protein
VARVIARGLSGAGVFAAGLIFGDLVWLATAILGLAVLAQTFQEVFLVLKYLGSGYLLYLAYRMWTAPSVAEDAACAHRERGPRPFLAGLLVTLSNPKVVAFYLALLPNLIDLRHVGLLGYAQLASICIAVLALVFASYAFVAAYARSLLRGPRTSRLLNRLGGAMMAGAGVTLATR